MESESPNTILSRAVLGGRLLKAEDLAASDVQYPDQPPDGYKLEDEVYLGYTYYLTPEEVKEAANALAVISEDEFRRRYDPDTLLEKGVYPEVWPDGDDREDDGELEEFLLPNYRELVRYYSDAAQRGNGMLTVLE